MHHRRGARATPPRAGPPRVPRPRASAQGAQNHNPNAQRPQAPGGGACFSCIKTRSLEHTQDTPVPTPDTHTRSQNTRQSTFLAPSASMEALRFMHGSIRAWSSQAPSPFSPHPVPPTRTPFPPAPCPVYVPSACHVLRCRPAQVSSTTLAAAREQPEAQHAIGRGATTAGQTRCMVASLPPSSLGEPSCLGSGLGLGLGLGIGLGLGLGLG